MSAAAPRLLRTGATTLRRTLLQPQQLQKTTRTFTTSTPRLADQSPGAVPDPLSGGKVKGRTGGGEPLDATAEHAAPKPKISNLSVPGETGRDNLTEEQKKEVDAHNKEFAEKHDHGANAPDDKVDKKYWSGQTQGKP